MAASGVPGGGMLCSRMKSTPAGRYSRWLLRIPLSEVQPSFTIRLLYHCCLIVSLKFEVAHPKSRWTVREPSSRPGPDRRMASRLQPPPPPQLFELPDPRRIRRPLYGFRYEACRAFGSAYFSTPAIQRPLGLRPTPTTPTLIALGTEYGVRPPAEGRDPDVRRTTQREFNGTCEYHNHSADLGRSRQRQPLPASPR